MSLLKNDPEMLEMLGRKVPAAPSPRAEVLPVKGGGTNMQGAYDASSRYDRDLITWNPSGNTADEDLLPEKRVMDARVRDTMRNDAYASSGSDIWKDNIVGSRFMLNSKPNYLALGLDSNWSEEFQEEVESLWDLSAESSGNYIDASRINGFTAMVRLAVGMFGMSGEVLAFLDWISDRDRPFKTAVQMVDPDRLSDPPGFLPTQNIRGGIEFDSRNKPVAYHIRKAQAYNWWTADSYKWERVPTTKPWGRQQIIHIYEQFRPDQSRGVAKMVSALKESRTTKRFRDVVLQNAVVNATYAASIESDLPAETVYQAIGGGQADDLKVREAIESYASGYLGAINAYSGGAKNLQLDGVRIPHLFPGTKLQLRPAGMGGDLGKDFEKSLLRYIAANLGVSYEQLSKDYSGTNYSTVRAAMTETWKTMQANKKMVADRFANYIYIAWLEEMISQGRITSLSRKAPNFWDGLNRDAYGGAEWIGASRGQIDELKETQAATLRLKYNLSTYEDELGRLGKDYRKVFDQIAREKALQEKLDIAIVPEGGDNMMNATTGATREKDASGSSDASDGDTNA